MRSVIEPSLLAFEKNFIPQQLQIVKSAGCEYIHYDVMDGQFVPNSAYDTEWLQLIQQIGLKANVHLMVQKPFQYIKRFRKFPLNSITFHPEPLSLSIVRGLIYYLKLRRIPCGLAIKPYTDVSKYLKILRKCDYVLIMGVQPGMGGQTFLHECLENLKKVYSIKNLFNKKLIIQLDGGVNPDIILLTQNYVDHFVMGTYLMQRKNIVEFLKKYQ